MTGSGKSRERTGGGIQDSVDRLDSRLSTETVASHLEWAEFGPVVAEMLCDRRSRSAKGERSQEPKAPGFPLAVNSTVVSMERFLRLLPFRHGGEAFRDGHGGARSLAQAGGSSPLVDGGVVRTVMRTGLFLRAGCAAALLMGAVGTAAAFDPGNGAGDDAASMPNVQALAPLPAPGRVGPGAPMVSAPAALSVPPGVSVKLLPGPIVPPTAVLSAEEEFRTGTRLYYAGDRKAALDQLRRAAEHGHPIAQWKLGKIYETGDGVPVNEAKAVEFYREVVDNHADEARGTPQAAFVASAFVSLGSYYLKGVEKAAIRPNVDRARELYTYAASIFGDTEAQYRLGRLYLEAAGDERDPRQAARWLTVAAKKGHCGAQAMLGQLLFTGDEGFTRRPVQGLMWLTIARANANGTGDDWIREVQEQVFSVASESERRRGVADAQDWIAKSGN